LIYSTGESLPNKILTLYQLYNLKLLQRLNAIKSSWAHSCVNWLQEETDTTHITTLMMGTDGAQNIGFFQQPIVAAVCLRRFY
jgi:hypothetical protein